MAEPEWLTKARSYLGFHEIGNNRGIEEFIELAHTGSIGDPWCAIFANACVEAVGIKGTRSPAAISFTESANFDRIPKPRIGAIAVFKRTGGNHVGFYTGKNKQGNPLILGGNQNDQVCIDPREDDPIGYYWPADVAVGTADVFAPAQPNGWTTGRGSWYSQYDGKYEWVDTGDRPGSAALTGCPDDCQGIALYSKENGAALGRWFEVRAPNGKISIEQQTDIGPHPDTKRSIDISAAAAERFGYSPKNFPTDSIFSWRPIAPPKEVASLSQVQQAVRYAAIRKDSPVIDQPSPPPLPFPPVIQQAGGQDFFMNSVMYFMQNPDAFNRIQAFMHFARTGQAGPAPAHDAPGPAPAPGPPGTVVTPAPVVVPTLPKWGLGTGILGTLVSAVLMKNGTVAPPIGDGSTLTGLLSVALPAALSLFGAGGGVAAVIAKAAPAIFQALSGLKK